MNMHQSKPEPVNSIFQRSWWLDAVAPGQWSNLEVYESGELCARMPIVVRHRCGRQVIDTPGLTHTLGPWLRPTDAKVTKRLSQENAWMLALIEQLPDFDYFSQNIHYSVQNLLPFHFRGFESSVAYTFVISDLSDYDKVFSEFDTSTRYEIRKARGRLACRTDLGVDTLWRLTAKSFKRWNRRPPYTYEYLSRLVAACDEQHAHRLFFAEDGEGRVHAALMLVYDDLASYYLVGGADPELRSSGAASMLLSEAIRFSTTVSRTFDFEGSMVEPIARFFRGFGGTPRPFIRVRGYSGPARVARAIRDLWKRKAG